jgi:hypothetical protein
VRQTGTVRLYLPATLRDLLASDGVRPSVAHAATSALAAALPDEDSEGLEFAAMLAAADASVPLLAADEAAPRRRVVVVVEVAGEFAGVADGLPSEVAAPSSVPWSRVSSIHVDEADAEADVAAAARGDADALDRAAERDLLWFDVSELDALRRLSRP